MCRFIGFGWAYGLATDCSSLRVGGAGPCGANPTHQAPGQPPADCGSQRQACGLRRGALSTLGSPSVLQLSWRRADAHSRPSKRLLHASPPCWPFPLASSTKGWETERLASSWLRASTLKRRQPFVPLGISGIDLEPYPYRVYPQGSLFANVVGFLNQERQPQAGLEQSRDDDLQRHEQARSLRRGADGTPLPDNLAPGVFFGDDLRLQLTLDARLQELAAKALSAQVKTWKAKKGVAIVMDVTNGELMALASTPTYDANRYWDFNPERFREWSVQDLYEPGSTFKPINLALALQEGVIQPNETVYDSGALTIGGWPIRNHDRKGNGVVDFATVLQVSSNVGMVQAMRKMRPSNYWDWLSRLGLDAKPDTDLPGAVAGQLKTKEQFTTQPIEPATAAFGQGFSLTPLKLVQLHALIANGGRLVSPHITRGLRAGHALAPSGERMGQPLLRPEVTRTVLNWMESVVEKGSGKGVRTPGYRIGGKTGTAQKAVNGVYVPGALICSFVATLPIEDPRYVVLVVVDEPQGEHAYGSTVALPVAKSIIDGLLVIEKIPPSGRVKSAQTDTPPP